MKETIEEYKQNYKPGKEIKVYQRKKHNSVYSAVHFFPSTTFKVKNNSVYKR